MGILKEIFSESLKETGKIFKETLNQSVKEVKQVNKERNKITKELEKDFALDWVKKTKKSRYINQSIKLTVAKRDKFRCRHCGKKLNPKEVEFDHIKPFSKDKQKSVIKASDIQLLCRKCNRKKSNKFTG